MGGREDVLDALTPFTEDADHLVGFAVKYARDGCERDLDTVEVRLRLTERNHSEVAAVLGMLQGHGFPVEKSLRGSRGGAVSAVLAVDVSGEGPDLTERDASGHGSEQGTLGG